jgi:hypothetical protein
LPRAKDTLPADTVVEAGNGFATLEAKVEEVQVEAAIEAELSQGDAAAAAAPVLIEEVSRAASAESAGPSASGAWRGDAAALRPAPAATGAAMAMLDAFTACAEAAMRFQIETIESFSRVRGPSDLASAQIAYGERTIRLYVETATRLAQVLPAPVPMAAPIGPQTA